MKKQTYINGVTPLQWWEEVSGCELNDKPSYEELQNAFHELHEECSTLSRTCAKQKNLILSLERKANDSLQEVTLLSNVSN